ncbi:hypothetical protein [Litorihabitans aurantiacus]|uniref:Membrane protein n=1 Tax=Litorihabitans aurantiacus TaxID=1930061 RepID=A0AA37XHL2_9MICO|nr:hypothetical protein [Litorihabitans aurantiacus]GMA32735.1 membrane protein [Litorihabitans aurantiacus]
MLGVYAASRVLVTGALLIARTHQGPSFEGWWPNPEGRPPYGVFVGRWWDAWWYERIWAGGYPDALPVRDGVVVINEWAFFPLYPGIVRAITTATGGTWIVVAPLVSLVIGAAALLVVHRLVTVAAPHAVAARPGLPLATVALVAFFPSAVVLQVAYTESLALLLVATTLLLVVRRRYCWAMLAVAALGFTRAVALPMAVVVAVHLLLRWREARAGREAMTRREVVTGVGLLGVAGLSGGIWPLIAGAVTGQVDAYVLTQGAWRPDRGIGLFAGFTRVETFSPLGVGLTIGAVTLIVGLLVLGALRGPRRIGLELWVWSAAYVLYLAAVGDLISSQLRFLLLAFPLAIVLVALVPRPAWAARAWTSLLLAGLAVAQVAWVWTVWMQVLREITFLKAP